MEHRKGILVVSHQAGLFSNKSKQCVSNVKKINGTSIYRVIEYSSVLQVQHISEKINVSVSVSIDKGPKAYTTKAKRGLYEKASTGRV